MRQSVWASLLFLLAFGASLRAVENGPLTVTIIRAEQKTRDRVVYWQVNTPLYREEPYFEVAVRAGELILVGEYEPRSVLEILPQAWKPGARVKARVGKHTMYLTRPNGTEWRFVIVQRIAAAADTAADPSASSR